MVEKFADGDMENYRVDENTFGISPYSELSSALIQLEGIDDTYGIPQIYDNLYFGIDEPMMRFQSTDPMPLTIQNESAAKFDSYFTEKDLLELGQL